MCFHSNQHPLSIKHPFISLYSKYQFFMFTCSPDMNSPVFPILDDIYCMSMSMMRLTEHEAQVYANRRLEPNLIISYFHPSVSFPVPVVSKVILLDSQHLFLSLQVS